MGHDDTREHPGPSVPGVALSDILGAGAFGTVYRGRHAALDLDVAVKVIDLARIGAVSRGGLLQEAQLMARLDHPNLLRVFDAGLLERHIYLVFEFMNGGSCAGLRHVAPDAAEDMSLQLLSGLQALHEARILHRDIKPANCLKRQDDRVKLADLGLAIELTSETQTSVETAGTIPFMAPELFDSPPRYAPVSDLYALGMTLACFVLDEAPFPRGSLTEMLPWILQGPRPSIAGSRPDLPAPLSALVERMISPRAGERPQTVAQALSELAAIAPAPVSDDRTVALGRPTVGPWIIGETVYSSSNWEGWAVTHHRTGAAGRLMRLQPDSPLRDVTEIVMAAAERAATLDDRHVVPMLDWGMWDDRVFVVTGAWGHTLQALVKARGRYDEVSALGFARDLAEALVAIHGRGLVYQTLDPGSAVVASDARSAQLSWPIYCVPAGSDAQQRVLVPRFAAPEALTRASPTIEPAVDVFGLGAVLLFLLTGDTPPRTEGSLLQFVRGKAPEVTAATASFIGHLLALDPAKRPSSDAAFARMRELVARLDGSAGR